MLLLHHIVRGGWRRFAPVLAALVCLVALSGCKDTVAVATDVHEDGSGQVQATVTLDPEAAAAVVDLEPKHKPGAAAVWNSVIPLAGLAAGAL